MQEYLWTVLQPRQEDRVTLVLDLGALTMGMIMNKEVSGTSVHLEATHVLQLLSEFSCLADIPMLGSLFLLFVFKIKRLLSGGGDNQRRCEHDLHSLPAEVPQNARSQRPWLVWVPVQHRKTASQRRAKSENQHFSGPRGKLLDIAGEKKKGLHFSNPD